MTASTTAVPSTVSASTGKAGSATTKLSRTLGAALVFGADNSFAENEKFNVSGDLCLHLDTSASALRAVRA